MRNDQGPSTESTVSARKGYTRCRSRGRLWAGGSWGVDEAHGVGAGNGVKEGKWSSSCRPNVFFAEPLLFAFHTARLAARHSRCGNCRLESRMRENRLSGSEGGEE